MAPDTKSNLEHFQRMEQRVFVPEFIADKKSLEIRNENFVKCEKVYKLKDQLKPHSDTVHSQEVDRYLCELCKKVFTRKDSLKKLQKTHSI